MNFSYHYPWGCMMFPYLPSSIIMWRGVAAGHVKRCIMQTISNLIPKACKMRIQLLKLLSKRCMSVCTEQKNACWLHKAELKPMQIRKLGHNHLRMHDVFHVSLPELYNQTGSYQPPPVTILLNGVPWHAKLKTLLHDFMVPAPSQDDPEVESEEPGKRSDSWT